jgi:methionine-rich copper-binding protein CopC
MIKSRSSTFTKVHSIWRACLLFVMLVVGGLSANAAISATVSPVAQNYEFCSTSSNSQTFTVTATTNCGGSPTGLDYMWFIKRFSGGIDTLASSGSGYNSGTTSALSVTSIQTLFDNGDSLFVEVRENATGCNAKVILGGWLFIEATAVPTIVLDGNKSVCQNSTVQWGVDVTAPNPTGSLTVTWTRTSAASVVNTVTHTLGSRDPALTTLDTFYSYLATLNRDLDTIRVEVENVCGAATAGPSVLYVSPLPTLSTGADVAICESAASPQNISFTVGNAQTNGSVNVAWTVSATVTGSVGGSVTDIQNAVNAVNTGSGNGTVNIDLAPLNLAPGTYTVTFNSISKDVNSPNANYSSSCTRTLSQNIQITVYPEPVVEITTADYENCQGATGSFDINISNATFGSPAQAVSWSFNLTQGGGSVANSCATGAGLSITNTGSGNQTVNVPTTSLAPGRYTFTLTGINNTTHTCVGTVSASPNDAVEVSVIARPNATLSPITQAVCEDDAGAFNISVSNAEYCTVGFAVADLGWSLAYTDGVDSDGPTTTGTGNTTIPVVSNNTPNLTPGIYTFEMTSIEETTTALGCDRTLSTANEYTLTVNPKPEMTAVVNGGPSAIICEGTTGTITIEVTNAEVAGIGQNWAITYTQEARAVSQANCGSNYNPGILPTPTITGNGNRTIAGSNALTFTIPSNLPAGRYRYTLQVLPIHLGTCSSSYWSNIPLNSKLSQFHVFLSHLR